MFPKVKAKPEGSIWTDDQWNAICLDGKNIIVSAGAGSGKTAVLTERILEKLKNGVLINQMIILTFTKAAAGEMRERIRKKIKKAIKEFPKLENQLYLVDQADITTFDSYSLSLVKKYHYILGMPKNIGIIDNVQLNIERKKIIDDIFTRYYDNEKFLKLLDVYTNKDDETIKNAILNISSKLDSICKKQDYLETYMDKYYDLNFIKEKINDYNKIIMQTSDVILMLIDNIKFVASEEEFTEYANKIEEIYGNLAYCKKYEDFKKVIVDAGKFPTMPRKKDLDPYEREEINNYKDKLKVYLKELERLVRYESGEEIENNILSLKDHAEIIVSLLKDLDNETMKFKKQINSYEFSDIMRFAIKLLEENDSVREDIKNFTNEIMIDEYQDTNDIGDYLVSLISKNNVYMVGDVKQSIYRFRNANPKLFMSKYNAYKKGDSGYAIDLAKNFRSREEVLSGINEMFSRIMDDDIGGANYLEGHVAIFGNKAYIKEGKTDQNYNLEIYNYDYDNFEDKKLYSKDEVEAFIIADDILEKIKNKEQIFDKDEKTFSDIKFKDIVILVDRKSKFELFKKIFDYKKIPLIIHKDEQFVYSNEIYVLKNLLKLIEYEKNKSYENYNYSFLSVARSYICDYNDNDIFSSVTNKDIMTNPIFQDLISKIKYLAKYSEEVSLSNLIVEIYNTFDFYSKSINIGNVANVTNKLDYIIDVCKTLEETGYNLEDFTNYFDEVFNKEIDIQFSNKKDMSSNSVNIMTIHKSKGLEYPICYFPHFYKAFNKSDLNDRFLFDQDLGIINPVFNDGLEPTIYKELMSYKYINEDISERLRVLYVALTRAKEKMIIVNPISSKNGNSLPRNDKNVVNILERQKYKCFEDIIVSLKEDLKPYITNKDINVSKAYLLKSNVDYKKLLETNDIKLETDLLNISKKAKETKTFSHQKGLIVEPKDMSMGTKIHEVLEYLDFDNIDIDKYDVSDFFKYKIKKLFKQEFIKPGNKYYKEYEFYIEDKKGIIDLLIENDDEVIIVDYKLKNIAPKYYEDQVKAYVDYIKTITNKKVSGYLYSILDEENKKIV